MLEEVPKESNIALLLQALGKLQEQPIQHFAFEKVYNFYGKLASQALTMQLAPCHNFLTGVIGLEFVDTKEFISRSAIPESTVMVWPQGFSHASFAETFLVKPTQRECRVAKFPSGTTDTLPCAFLAQYIPLVDHVLLSVRRRDELLQVDTLAKLFQSAETPAALKEVPNLTALAVFKQTEAGLETLRQACVLLQSFEAGVAEMASSDSAFHSIETSAQKRCKLLVGSCGAVLSKLHGAFADKVSSEIESAFNIVKARAVAKGNDEQFQSPLLCQMFELTDQAVQAQETKERLQDSPNKFLGAVSEPASDLTYASLSKLLATKTLCDSLVEKLVAMDAMLQSCLPELPEASRTVRIDAMNRVKAVVAEGALHKTNFILADLIVAWRSKQFLSC